MKDNDFDVFCDIFALLEHSYNFKASEDQKRTWFEECRADLLSSAEVREAILQAIRVYDRRPSLKQLFDCVPKPTMPEKYGDRPTWDDFTPEERQRKQAEHVVMLRKIIDSLTPARMWVKKPLSQRLQGDQHDPWRWPGGPDAYASFASKLDVQPPSTVFEAVRTALSESEARSTS